MFTSQMLLQKYMVEEKMVLQDLLNVKKLVDQMDLLEFKAQWHNRSRDYTQLTSTERLKYMLMSIKILQAKVDLKRMINSIKELSTHPEPQQAIYYYLRSNLWKFLDHFRYMLLVDDILDADKLECIDLLDGLTSVILQDEEFTTSSLNRLRKIQEQVRLFKQSSSAWTFEASNPEFYGQLEKRITQLIQHLEPAKQVPSPQTSPVSVEHALGALSPQLQHLLTRYSDFSISRISIERSGVLSIIKLLHDFPLKDLETHRDYLQETLERLEHQVLYDASLTVSRNQCAYALVVLLEIVKMHQGLPVLLSKIFDLCSYMQFPPVNASLQRELQDLKGKVTEISQKKVRPIIEDVLWKNPSYLAKIQYLRAACPWCYRQDRKELLNIDYIRRIVTTSFDRLEATPGFRFGHESVTKSRLSEMVIEILGLLVNLEPSPHFLKLHSQEIRQIKHASQTDESHARLVQQQYTTYKNHLKFLQDSIDYYNGISEKMEMANQAKLN